MIETRWKNNGGLKVKRVYHYVQDELIGEKAKLKDALDNITITTAAGNVFDANLESRVNMADAILASDTLGQTETVWRLADNSEITVDIAELREAHALALQSYAQIKAIGTSK
jgi:hypothetical protein